MAESDHSFHGELLESIFKTSKKTIQEYVREIERNNLYRSCRGDTETGYILDDRSRLIDLYEACLQQDAHIRSVIETLESQILGDRYMLARVNEKESTSRMSHRHRGYRVLNSTASSRALSRLNCMAIHCWRSCRILIRKQANWPR